MALQSEYITLTDLVAQSNVTLNDLRLRIVAREVATYAHVRRWSVLWVPDTFQESPRQQSVEDEIFGPSDLDSGQSLDPSDDGIKTSPDRTLISVVDVDTDNDRNAPIVTLQDKEGRVARSVILSYTGRVRLGADEAAEVAVSSSHCKIWHAFDPFPVDRNWSGGGSLLGFGFKSGSSERFGFESYRLALSDLWLSRSDAQALTKGGKPQLPNPTSIPTVEPTKKTLKLRERFTSSREALFSTAFGLLAIRPDLVERRADGTIIYTRLIETMRDYWPLVWKGDPQEELSPEHASRMLSQMEKRIPRLLPGK